MPEEERIRIRRETKRRLDVMRQKGESDDALLLRLVNISKSAERRFLVRFDDMYLDDTAFDPLSDPHQ